MAGGPPIDDRRRFKQLWKELLLARVGISAGLFPVMMFLLPMIAAALSAPGRDTAGFLMILVQVLCSCLAMPSLATHRPGGISGAVGMASYLAVIPAIYFSATGAGVHLELWMIFGIAGGTLGTIEGLCERAIATTCAGTLGGILTGAMAGRCAMAMLPGGEPGPSLGAFGAAVVSAPLLQVGIGLSLALGRWIRDWPKPKAGVDPRGGEV